jgi:hypothetical protein
MKFRLIKFLCADKKLCEYCIVMLNTIAVIKNNKARFFTPGFNI